MNELRAKPAKVVNWADVPAGVAVYTSHKKLRLCIYQGLNRDSSALVTGAGDSWLNDVADLTLAPAADQPWIAVQDNWATKWDTTHEDWEEHPIEGLIFDWHECGGRFKITGFAG